MFKKINKICLNQIKNIYRIIIIAINNIKTYLWKFIIINSWFMNNINEIIIKKY